MPRTIIIGDIHGSISEYKEILNLVDYKSPNVRIILLGDQIDRGEDSNACIALSRELKIECVMGNHEQKFLLWLRGDRKPTPNKPHYLKFSNKDIEYISSMPTYIKVGNTIVVHAGLRAGVSLSNQTENDLLHIRFSTSQGNFVSLKKILKYGKEATDAHFWTEYGSFGYDIVYGHQVHSMDNICIDRYNDGTACYGLDTGVVFGGKLSVLVLETKEVIQVQAKNIYYKRTL